MSEILSNVLDNATVESAVRLSTPELDKAHMKAMDDEQFFKQGVGALLAMPVASYCGIADDDLIKYLKGALHRFKHLQALRALAFCAADSDERIDRYTREMRRCNQAICRIRRERMRRVIVEVDANPRE